MGKCKICSFSATSETVLNQHVGMVHTKEPQVRVQINVSQAVQEVRDALADADYKCQKCGFSSPLESDLTMHMKEAHPKRSVMCDKCSYFTEDMRDLREHVVTAHGGALSS